MASSLVSWSNRSNYRLSKYLSRESTFCTRPAHWITFTSTSKNKRFRRLQKSGRREAGTGLLISPRLFVNIWPRAGDAAARVSSPGSTVHKTSIIRPHYTRRVALRPSSTSRIKCLFLLFVFSPFCSGLLSRSTLPLCCLLLLRFSHILFWCFITRRPEGEDKGWHMVAKERAGGKEDALHGVWCVRTKLTP